MEKEFIPYEQALALKELGFDEPCLACFLDSDYQFCVKLQSDNKNFEYFNNNTFVINNECVSAPLYQQAFRWFREYKLFPEINLHDREDEETWRITISILGVYDLAYNQNVGIESYYKTYEEAELVCLIKLIEIVKSI